jgi:CRP-like cAMP-binding protein
MNFAPLPQYVVDAAEWFRDNVADPKRRIRGVARRAIRDLREIEGALLVRSGLVAITSIDASGARHTVGLRYPGELVLPFCTSRTVVIEAVQDSKLDVTDDAAFTAALSERPEIELILRMIGQRELAIAYEWLARSGLRDALSRLAHLLCETYTRMDADACDTLTLPFTQQQLGEITGQTSVNVNRMMAELRHEAVIEGTGRVILVRDWVGLTRIARFDPAYLK